MSKQRQRLNSSYRTREGFQQDVSPKVNHECIEVISQAEKGGRILWTEKTTGVLLRTMGYMQETTNNPLFLEKMGCMYMCSVAQWCPTLCDPMDCSPPGSSVHGILQARILEWIAIPFSRGIFPTLGLNPGLPHCRQILYHLSHQGNSYQLHSHPASIDLGMLDLRKHEETNTHFQGTERATCPTSQTGIQAAVSLQRPCL